MAVRASGQRWVLGVTESVLAQKSWGVPARTTGKERAVVTGSGMESGSEGNGNGLPREQLGSQRGL